MKTTLTLALLLAFARPGHAQDVTPIKVPFELLETQHIVVHVKINGEGPYRMLFDTGSPVNLLNTKTAAASGVIGKDGKNPAAGLGGTQMKIKSLDLGSAKVENVAAVVMNHPTVEALSKAMGPVEGIVGYPFFARFKMTIDYQAKELTFVPSGFEPKDTLNTLQILMLGGKKKPAGPIAPAAQFGLRVQKDAKDEDAGVNVIEVFEGSPAAVAGVKVGDRLLIVDDRWTDSVADCYSAAAAVRPGTEIRVTIRRDKMEQALKLTVRPGV